MKFKTETGLEWLPVKSPSRKLDWTRRMQPRRVLSVGYNQPFNFKECFNCYEEGIWFCDHCKMLFCRFDECKEIHEYEHLLSRMGGPDEDQPSQCN